jgi:hypothetical protein
MENRALCEPYKSFPIRAKTYPGNRRIHYERNGTEKIVSDSYRQSLAEGGLKSELGWRALTGEDPNQSKISIVIPIHREPGIANTLDCILFNMNRPHNVSVEVVVVLDESDDSTKEQVDSIKKSMVLESVVDAHRGTDTDTILQKYEEELKKNKNTIHSRGITLHIVEQQRTGKLQALKIGAQLLDSQHIIIADGDIIVSPDAIPLLYAACKMAPVLDVVGGQLNAIDTNTISDRAHRLRRYSDTKARHLTGGLMAIRKELLLQTPKTIREDYLWEQQVLKEGKHQLVCVAEAISYYILPQTIDEGKRNDRRMQLGAQQVEQIVGSLIRPHEPPQPNKIRKLFNIALGFVRDFEAARWAIKLNNAIKLDRQQQANAKEQAVEWWEPSMSTKQVYEKVR